MEFFQLALVEPNKDTVHMARIYQVRSKIDHIKSLFPDWNQQLVIDDMGVCLDRTTDGHEASLQILLLPVASDIGHSMQKVV